MTMGALRIMAGPGTGKTYTLMRHIESLLKDDTDPSRMLLVTFTRTAATDLKEELTSLKAPGADKIQSGTLHAFCLKVLHSAEFFLQTNRRPRILFNYETRFLLEDLRGKGLGKIKQLEKQLQAFEAMWAREHEQVPGVAEVAIDRAFEQELEEWLRFHQAMLLSELVPETLKYLRANPLSPILSSFDHILVDEYQDLNRAEQSLIDLLAKQSTLTVVGDEDQSIYQRFRHAHPEGIAQFHETHADTEDMLLEVCRRCPTRIVEMANSLISYNTQRVFRELTPFPDNGEGDIHVVQWKNMKQEAEGIAQYVSSKIKSGEFNPGKVLILCPRRQFAYGIRDELKKLRHDAHSFFQEEVFDGKPQDLDECQSQEAFTLLRLVANSNDRVALRCWLGFGHSSDLRAKEYRQLWKGCYQEQRDPLENLKYLSSGDYSISGHTKGIEQRYELLLERLDALKDKSVKEIFQSIFPQNEEWAAKFYEMVGEIVEDTELEDIIDTILSETAQPELPTDVDFIRLMSLHKSKGLSADHVIVTGFIQSLIPNSVDKDASDIEQLRQKEEQRRLFYVGITRTKKTLVLSSIASLPRNLAYKMGVHLSVRSGNKTHGNTITSMFFSELGKSCPSPVPGDQWKY